MVAGLTEAAWISRKVQVGKGEFMTTAEQSPDVCLHVFLTQLHRGLQGLEVSLTEVNNKQREVETDIQSKVKLLEDK